MYDSTVTNVDQILPLNVIFFSLETHAEVMRDHSIHGLVGLFVTSYHVQV